MTRDSASSDPIALPDAYQLRDLFRAGDPAPYRMVFRDPATYFESWHISIGKPTEVAELAIALLQGSGTLIDVGANIGLVSIPVARAGSRVISVEPNPKNCLQITLSAAINGYTNLELHQAALTGSDGIVGFSGEEAWGHVSNAEQSCPVMALRLDTLVARTQVTADAGPDCALVIKIDVEGHEAAVFAGATKTLTTLRPIVIFENSEVEGDPPPSSGRPKEIIEAYDYSLYNIRGEVLVPSSAHDIQEGYVCDFLAVPRERLAVLDRLGWQVRPLSEAERFAWIQEMVDVPMAFHRRHAVGVLKRLATEGGTDMAATRPIIEALIEKDEVAESHKALRGMLAAIDQG